MDNSTDITEDAVLLEQEIITQLTNNAFSLVDGITIGDGENAVTHRRVEFRELTAGDVIDAQAAAEKVVSTPQGPQLVTSPTLMGVEVMRRQIATVGDLKGPLSMTLVKKLSNTDFNRLSIALDVKDQALAAQVSNNRGRVAAVSE